MDTKTVDVQKAQKQLHELLTWVSAGGEVILTDGSTPVARIVPPDVPSTAPRIAGLHAGAIWVSDDFDEPLPDDFWTDASAGDA